MIQLRPLEQQSYVVKYRFIDKIHVTRLPVRINLLELFKIHQVIISQIEIKDISQIH